MSNRLAITALGVALAIAAAPSYAETRDGGRFLSTPGYLRISTGTTVAVPQETTVIDKPFTLVCRTSKKCALVVLTSAQVSAAGISSYRICALVDGVEASPCNSFFAGQANTTVQTVLHLSEGSHTVQSQITATFASGQTSGSIDNYQIVYTLYQP